MNSYLQWKKYTISYTQVKNASTTTTISIDSLPAKTLLSATIMKASQAFIGGSLTDVEAEIFGWGNQAFNGQNDILQVVSGSHYFLSDNRNQDSGYAIMADLTQAPDLTCVFTGDSNLDQLTQGSLDIWIEFVTLP
jgi:hypothetical protein